MGIKDITTFNLALLGKWRWNLFQNESQLWVKVLEAKYGGWRGLEEAPSDKFQSLWWRDLKMMLQTTQQGDTIIMVVAVETMSLVVETLSR